MLDAEGALGVAKGGRCCAQAEHDHLAQLVHDLQIGHHDKRSQKAGWAIEEEPLKE